MDPLDELDAVARPVQRVDWREEDVGRGGVPFLEYGTVYSIVLRVRGASNDLLERPWRGERIIFLARRRRLG